MRTGIPTCVAFTGDRCGEGAVWHAAEDAIYWTDINRFLVHRYSPADRAVRTWLFDEPAVALALTDRDDTLVVVLASRVLLWQPCTDTRTEHGFHLRNSPSVRLNESKADPRGSLWLGSMRNNVLPDGSATEAGGTDGILHRLDPDGRVSEWRTGFGIQNTLAWSPGRTLMYFADTLTNTIFAGDYDPLTGALGGERIFLRNFSRGLPDGSTMDVEGHLWNCRFFGGCIVRIAPNGAVDSVIEMPVSNITTCAFGGADGSTLYVTTAASSANERLAGSLFAIQTETRGLEENKFRVFGPA